jgi:addiction module RelE/StbE family toxin
MSVRYSRRALADIVRIADHVREHNPRAAAALEKRIRSSIEQLQMFPLIGRPTDDPDIRMFPIVRYPYLVFYEVLDREIAIHHIRHARRKPLDPGDARS